MRRSEMTGEMGILTISRAWDGGGMARLRGAAFPAITTILAISLRRDSYGIPAAPGTSGRHLSRYLAPFRGGIRDRRDAPTADRGMGRCGSGEVRHALTLRVADPCAIPRVRARGGGLG